MNTPRTVLDVLALAGGLTELAERKIEIERHGTGEKASSLCLEPATAAFAHFGFGDSGYSALHWRAGSATTMTNNEAQLSVLELVARAGGTNNSAVPSHTKLMRKSGSSYTETQIPLSDMQKGKRADLPLQAHDIVKNHSVTGAILCYRVADS